MRLFPIHRQSLIIIMSVITVLFKTPAYADDSLTIDTLFEVKDSNTSVISLDDSNNMMQKKVQSDGVFTPLQENKELFGSVRITIYPKQCDLYLNGRLIGKGDTVISGLKGGYYKVGISYKKREKSKIVYILPNDLTSIKLDLSRSFLVDISPSFSQVWAEGIHYIGPSISIGVTTRHFSMHFSKIIAFYSEPVYTAGRGVFFTGPLLECKYNCYERWNTLRVSSGVLVGKLYYETDLYADDGVFYQYLRGAFYGGPIISLTAHWKALLIDTKYTLLFGHAFGQIVSLGAGLEL